MTTKPTFSIIVPVYNEESNLHKFHNSIRKIDLFSESELIYVDDFSTDKSWEILQSFESGNNIHIFRLDKNYPVGYVRAFGVNKAKGEYIASIDADCIPTQNWLKMTKYLEDNIGVIGFPVSPPPEYDYLDQKFIYVGDGKPNPSLYLHGSGVIMKKNVITEVGNYPIEKRVGEDTRLFGKIIKHGYDIKYIEEAKIIHMHKQQNFHSFLKRYYRDGLNTTSRITLILYNILFPLLLILAIPIEYYYGVLGVLYIFVPIMFLANPKIILTYVKLFQKPKFFIQKVIIFEFIKIAASIAFVAGVWVSTFRKLFHLNHEHR